jgi:SAM-dependent methyltransferase
LYLYLTSQTGRARGQKNKETVADITRYFHSCFTDYFTTLNIPTDHIGDFLKGKRLLEYGPGDLPGASLLMLAYGAEQVVCIDRYPLLSLSEKNIGVLRSLMAELPADMRRRLGQVFQHSGDPASGFNPDKITYIVGTKLAGTSKSFDFVYSRAVMEHVMDLDTPFHEMKRALSKNGVGAHKVDLSSHGLHKLNPLDFLCWPGWLWDAMQRHKGGPNRHRIDFYRELLHRTGFDKWRAAPTGHYTRAEVTEIRSCLDPCFRHTSDDDLAWKGCWLVHENSS